MTMQTLCMADTGGIAKVRWEDGVPVSERFDDPYYARTDGLAESRHVFLEGNGLAARWRAGERFTVAELGFGTGLNFLAAWQLWRGVAAPGEVLDFVSFERFPLESDQIARALGHWPELGALAGALLGAWPPGQGDIDLPQARLRVVPGDARETVPAWHGAAGAWFLDGFAPARNPEMWAADLMAAVGAHTVPGGTFATYSAAGRVRRALEAAGFQVTRRQGFGTKREMLAGTLPATERGREPWQPRGS